MTSLAEPRRGVRRGQVGPLDRPGARPPRSSSRRRPSSGSSPGSSHSPAGQLDEPAAGRVAVLRQQQTRSSSSTASTITAPGCSSTSRRNVRAVGAGAPDPVGPQRHDPVVAVQVGAGRDRPALLDVGQRRSKRPCGRTLRWRHGRRQPDPHRGRGARRARSPSTTTTSPSTCAASSTGEVLGVHLDGALHLLRARAPRPSSTGGRDRCPRRSTASISTPPPPPTAGCRSTDLRADNTLVVTTAPDRRDQLRRHPAHGRPHRRRGLRWTSLECDDARRLWACFDQPDLKARHRFTRDRPRALDGARATCAPRRSVSPSSGARVWSFPDTPPLSPYVVVVNAGPFHEIREQHGDHDLGLYCRQSLRDSLDRDAGWLFDLTRRGLAFFGDRFGQPFPRGPLRPGLRPQHGRRDGELGLRHLGRRLPLPHAPDPRTALPDRDHAAPRDGPHVVRRPGHDDAGGTTSGSTRRSPPGPRRGPPPRPPSSPTRGPSSSSAASSRPTAPTWGRPPTRSATTSWTSTPRWPTSTRSPTPRASRCSTSSWPTSARTPSSAGSRTTSPGTPGATPASPT